MNKNEKLQPFSTKVKKKITTLSLSTKSEKNQDDPNFPHQSLEKITTFPPQK